MANAYVLSAPSSQTDCSESPWTADQAPIAVFNHVGRAFADTFAMLFEERPEAKQCLASEEGFLRVDGAGLVEADDLKRLFRDKRGSTITLIDPATGISADLTYFIVS